MCIREFLNYISPHFKFLLSNERLDFLWSKNKIKRINNADSFSQPSVIMFTKGADIFGNDCIAEKKLKVYYFYIKHFFFKPGT